MVSQTNEKQINHQPKIKQTNVHTHKHCFITLICVSIDLLKVANSIIIFSLTKLMWGADREPPPRFSTTRTPRLSPDSRSRKERPDETGRSEGGRVSLESIRRLEILVAVLCL